MIIRIKDNKFIVADDKAYIINFDDENHLDNLFSFMLVRNNYNHVVVFEKRYDVVRREYKINSISKFENEKGDGDLTVEVYDKSYLKVLNDRMGNLEELHSNNYNNVMKRTLK